MKSQKTLPINKNLSFCLVQIKGHPHSQQKNKAYTRKRRYLGRYFAHPMMQNRRAKRDDYKPS
ncbi:hypothetical protein, partial [Piscirickettsia salmonis]